MYQNILILILLFTACGCVGSKDSLHRELSRDDKGNNQYQGHYKIGKQYKIKDQTYTPKENKTYKQEGMASWYTSKTKFHPKKTANGDKYNKYMLSAAHRDLPMPSLVKVTNLHNNKSLIVMVNDRGPFTKNRIIDVSEQAATILDFKSRGVAKVRVQYLHHETKDFLAKIALDSKEGAKAKHKVKTAKCSINCHIKLVNLKYRLAIAP